MKEGNKNKGFFEKVWNFLFGLNGWVRPDYVEKKVEETKPKKKTTKKKTTKKKTTKKKTAKKKD